MCCVCFLQTFWDLTSLYEGESIGNLHIIENEFLGKGGFGFVCKGELRQEVCKLLNDNLKNCATIIQQ